MVKLTEEERKAKVRERARRRRMDPEHNAKVRARARIREATPEYKAQRSAYNANRYFSPGFIEQRTAARHVRRSRPEGRAISMLGFAKFRAQKAGMEFDLTINDILPQIAAGICQATGQSFDFGLPEDGKRRNPNAPSIDRVDNKRGYTKDNIKIVTWSYNTAKNEGTDAELLRLAELIVAYQATRVNEDA